MLRYLFLTLLLAAGCTHVSANGVRVTTFGTGRTVVTPDRIESESDGTNLFGIVAKVVDAARRFFGGGDTIIQTVPAAPAPPAAPVFDREVSA